MISMKNIKLFEEFVFEGTAGSHSGLAEIFQALKPFGFQMDEKGKTYGGTPTVFKGDDSNGVVIQFKTKGGALNRPSDEFFVNVAVGGKEKMTKSYKMTSQEALQPTKFVQMVLKDLEPWKKYAFPKTGPMG